MAITLFGPERLSEGATGEYAVSTDTALIPGASLVFTLETGGIGGSATENVDYLPLSSSDIVGADGFNLSFVISGGIIIVTATNTSTDLITAGSNILTFGVEFLVDRAVEVEELFAVTLSSSSIGVVNSQVFTFIENVGGIISADTTVAQWAGLDGDLTVYDGIAGTELNDIRIETGSGNNNVSLTDAIAFANLDTGSGDDAVLVLVEPLRDTPYVQFGVGAYKATISTGLGDDIVNVQSSENREYVRDTPQSEPAYGVPDYEDSLVDVGAGNDYVYAFLPYNSKFLGGDGIDVIRFYGRFFDWSYQLVDVNGGGLDITSSDNASDQSVWTVGANISSTARQNVVQGFEFIQFNDILLDVRESLVLSEPGAVAEGAAAVYTIALAGDGLLRGETVTFALKLSGETALKDLDFLALAQSALQGGKGVTVEVLGFDPVTGSITAIATANSRNFAAGESIASVSLSTLQDVVVEGSEALQMCLSGFFDDQVITTTITDNDAAAITLTGPLTVAEGSSAMPYSVALSGVGLGASQDVTFTLDTASGTATEGTDFSSLVEAGLVAATGVTLSGISTGANGVITVTARNTSGIDLATNAALLSFSISTNLDNVEDGNKDFLVTLASSTDTVVNAAITTSIADIDAAAISLTGPSFVEEGAQTTPYTVALGSVGLGVGQGIRLTLDLVSGTSEVGSGFEVLNIADFVPASAIVLSSVAYGPNGSVTVTATNSGLSALAGGAQLLRFVVSTIDNDIVQLSESTASISVSSPVVSGGTYLAGVDIQSGTYRGLLSGAFPYWKISSDPNGSDLIDAGFPDGPFYVNIKDGQYLTLQDVDISLDSPPSSDADGSAQSSSFSVVLTSPAEVLSSEVSTLIIDDEVPPGVSVSASTQDGGVVIVAAANAGAVSIIGTSYSDVITGNNFANQIYGDTGSDVMTGLLGADIFRFRLADGLSQGDQITDFNPLEDKIQLADVSRASALGKLFKGKAEISAKAFAKAFGVVNSSALAETSKKQLVYDQFSGGLFYNEDGKKIGFGQGGQIAALPSLLNLNSTDISLLYTDQPF